MLNSYRTLIRKKGIERKINYKLKNLEKGCVLDIGNLSEEEMEFFSREYNNDKYNVIGSDVDFKNVTKDGRLRYCFSLMEISKNA